MHCGILSGSLQSIYHHEDILVVGRPFPCLLSVDSPDPEKHAALSSALPGSGR
jgi:hypothetical protein